VTVESGRLPAEGVQRMFDRIAPVYDAMNRVMTAGLDQRWRAETASAVVRPGERVLDSCCGTGDLAVACVRAGGRVTGLDFSERMLARARKKSSEVEWVQGDALELPFEDGSFDAALAQLVVHFMTDPVAGLREMARVTRPGGAIAACVWDFGSGRAPLSLFWRAVLDLDPSARDESDFAGARGGDLTRLFAAAGLVDVDETELQVTRSFEGFEDWWEPYTHGVGPAGSYVVGLDEAGRSALRERCRSMLPNGPFSMTAVAWAARGRA